MSSETPFQVNYAEPYEIVERRLRVWLDHSKGQALTLWRRSLSMLENVSMITLDQLRTEKKAAIVHLAKQHGASNIRVFGSVARGDNREESDIDFLVDFEKGRSLFDLIRFKLDLQDLLNVTVDVVTPRSLNYLRQRVLAEAQPL